MAQTMQDASFGPVIVIPTSFVPVIIVVAPPYN